MKSPRSVNASIDMCGLLTIIDNKTKDKSPAPELDLTTHDKELDTWDQIPKSNVLEPIIAQYLDEAIEKPMVKENLPPPPLTPEVQEDDDDEVIKAREALRTDRKKSRRKVVKKLPEKVDDDVSDEDLRMAEEAAKRVSKLNQNKRSISPKSLRRSLKMAIRKPAKESSPSIAEIPVFMLPADHHGLPTILEDSQLFQGYTVQMTLKPHSERRYSGLMSLAFLDRERMAKSATTALEFKSYCKHATSSSSKRRRIAWAAAA